MLHAATPWFALVANVLPVRLTRFKPPRLSTPCQTVLSRPGGKLCVGIRAMTASLRTG